MRTIENSEDYNNLIKQNKPILLDFYADWCGPCQALLPIVEKLSAEYDGKIEIQKVNVDQNHELATKFGVRSIPALFFIKDEKIIDKEIGLQSEAFLRKKLDALIS